MEVRVEVRPRWPFRLVRRLGLDRVARVRGGVVHRLVHVEEVPVVVRAAQPGRDRVVLGAHAPARDVAEEAIARVRSALGVDDDLRPFHEAFRHDPLIGPALRRHPDLRVMGRPEPFEALAWAVTEQLIDTERAGAIQRGIVRALGPRCPETGLRDVPSAAAVAAAAPAELAALGLHPSRALTLRRAAAEVASGRIDLRARPHEAGWRRLRAIPGIGAWTVEMLALHGQRRLDQVPAGDLNLLKAIGRARAGAAAGQRAPLATEDDVRTLFAPYGRWAGMAAFAVMVGGAGRLPLTAPRRAGTPS